MLSAVLVSMFTTVFTIFVVSGVSRKSVAAILGTVFGVIIAAVSAVMFGIVAGIDGYNVSDIESLLYIAQYSKVNVGELLFAGIIISALGAVMDVAVDIASAMNEVKRHKPDITRQALFHAGMNVGRDTMGTMSNTLILAFVGGSIGPYSRESPRHSENCRWDIRYSGPVHDDTAFHPVQNTVRRRPMSPGSCPRDRRSPGSPIRWNKEARCRSARAFLLLALLWLPGCLPD